MNGEKSLQELATALRRTQGLVAKSGDTIWSTRTTENLTRALERQIKRIQEGKRPRKLILIDLFAPTGDIQEISIANDWGDEFLSLSAVVDSFTGRG